MRKQPCSVGLCTHILQRESHTFIWAWGTTSKTHIWAEGDWAERKKNKKHKNTQVLLMLWLNSMNGCIEHYFCWRVTVKMKLHRFACVVRRALNCRPWASTHCRRTKTPIHMLTEGEIGCFLSHYNIWKQVQLGSDWCKLNSMEGWSCSVFNAVMCRPLRWCSENCSKCCNKWDLTGPSW